jgi:hypothetical protein
MAVTKQVYTASPTWTASGMANVFRSAFIDAGLMTDWYDSFLSGSNENRILAVQHNAGTYGTTYYWFMFTTTGWYQQITTGWNATTHVPTGTQYLDYFNTTTNSTAGLVPFTGYVASTTLTVTRYTSGVNSAVSWFRVANGTTGHSFMITKPGYDTYSGYIDYTYSCNNGFVGVAGQALSNNINASINFYYGGLVRRSIIGCFAGLSTASPTYTNKHTQNGYNAAGSTSANSEIRASTAGLWLPVQSNAVNTGLPASTFPVVTNVQPSLWLPTLPNDFGIVADINNNTQVRGDTFIVTAGVSEWEMLEVITTTQTRMMFMARTV